MLIVGLGNPGREYEDTRHNAGFKVVDRLVAGLNANKESDGSLGFIVEKTSGWNFEKKFSSDAAEITLKRIDKTIIKNSVRVKIIKPLLYMNRSGDPVRNFYDYFEDFFLDDFFQDDFFLREESSEYRKNEAKESSSALFPLVVVYDELDFDPGIVRLKKGGSAGGHNGLADIIRALSRDNFYRVRVGIGHPRRSDTPNMPVSNWVLGVPRGDDQILFEEGLAKADRVVRSLLLEGYSEASRRARE